jgi:hypothetical protein
MQERDELIDFCESDEQEWRQYFTEFREKVFPMFEEMGFTFQQAFVVWRQEQVITTLNGMEKEL